MPKTYTITAENSKELRQAMKNKKNIRFYAKLQSVALRGEGKNNEEISIITGYHPAYISHLVSIYCNEGLDELCKDNRKGGNNRNLTAEQEKEFLCGFEEAAKQGNLTTISEIAKAYDEAIGKQHKSKSSVYYLLHKHGWRLISPKKQHPGKANNEVIETSKKLTLNSKK